MPLAPGAFAASDETERKLEAVVSGLRRRFDLEDLEPAADGGFAARAPSGDRLDEIKQHLLDLEYLDDSAEVIEAEAPNPEILAALEAFVAELSPMLDADIAAALETDEPAPPGPGPAGGPVPSALVLEQLRRAVSFDGEIALTRIPRLGEHGLRARVLHVQLKRLGLYHRDAGDPVSAVSLNGLRVLSSWLFAGPDVAGEQEAWARAEQALPLLSDVRALLLAAKRLAARRPIVYRRAGDAESDLRFEDLRIREGRFETRGGFFTRLFGAGPGWDEEDEDGPGSAEERARSLTNAFVLRVLQIGLWTLGFYHGRHDGLWGALSHRALDEALEAYNVERDEALLALEGGYWAVNLPYLVARLFSEGAASEQAFEEQLAVLERESGRQGGDDQDPDRESSVWQSLKAGFRDALRKGRRILVGAKSLVRSALDGLVKGVLKAAEAIAGLVGPLRNFILFAYRGAREGVHMLVRTIRPFLFFVLRKPIVTQDESGRVVALSTFDLDRDVAFWSAPDAPRRAIDEHRRLCRRLARALYVVLLFAGKSIHLLLAAGSGPIGWVRILVSVLRAIAGPGTALTAASPLAA